MKCDLENSYLLVHLSPRQTPPSLSGPGPLHILELIIKLYVFNTFCIRVVSLAMGKIVPVITKTIWKRQRICVLLSFIVFFYRRAHILCYMTLFAHSGVQDVSNIYE